MEKAKKSLKEYVKEQYGKELSDEEAEELFEELRAEGAISEEELERVAAGASLEELIKKGLIGTVNPRNGGVWRIVGERIVGEQEGK